MNIKFTRKRSKVVIILMLLSILGCLLYLPWKAEKHFSYGNVLTRPLGYAIIGYKPPIYTESDFLPTDNSSFTAFEDIAKKHNTDLREKLNREGIEIHPSWVKNWERIDYTQVMINIAISIIFWSIVLLLVNLI